MNRIKFALSAAYASILSIVVAVFLTITSELSAPFKETLKLWSGHHWRTKSYLVLITFILGTFVFFIFALRSNPSEKTIHRATIATTVIALLGAIVITGFYVLHFINV